jgi:DNA-binding transcriptional ArsR family regulator
VITSVFTRPLNRGNSRYFRPPHPWNWGPPLTVLSKSVYASPELLDHFWASCSACVAHVEIAIRREADIMGVRAACHGLCASGHDFDAYRSWLTGRAVKAHGGGCGRQHDGGHAQLPIDGSHCDPSRKVRLQHDLRQTKKVRRWGTTTSTPGSQTAEELVPRQRAILAHLARAGRPISAAEIAGALGLAPGHVSAQLSRLAAAGVTSPSKQKGRHAFAPLLTRWISLRATRDDPITDHRHVGMTAGQRWLANHTRGRARWTLFTTYDGGRGGGALNGSPYRDVSETLRASFAFVIRVFEETVRTQRATPLVVVGSGGSTTACHFVARTPECYARLPARVLTPLEFLQSPALWPRPDASARRS